MPMSRHEIASIVLSHLRTGVHDAELTAGTLYARPLARGGTARTELFTRFRLTQTPSTGSYNGVLAELISDRAGVIDSASFGFAEHGVAFGPNSTISGYAVDPATVGGADYSELAHAVGAWVALHLMRDGDRYADGSIPTP